jgi:hypothetical protein
MLNNWEGNWEIYLNGQPLPWVFKGESEVFIIQSVGAPSDGESKRQRYENVPHFCFTCGRVGHAAANCEEGKLEDHGIKFGES